MRSGEEKRSGEVEETGEAVLESPYRVVKTLTYNDLLAKYDFKDRLETRQAWIFFKNRFAERYFDPSYFDQWVNRFANGYATNSMDSESLETWKAVAYQVDDLIRKEIVG